MMGELIMEQKEKKLKGAARCLQFDKKPLTPQNIRKFRKSYFSEPGKRVTHYGCIEDEIQLHEQLLKSSEEHLRHGGKRILEQENAKKVESLQQILKTTTDKSKKLNSNHFEKDQQQSEKQKFCSTLEGVFYQTPSGSFKEYLDDRKESIYQSHQREPLGKPYVRGIQQPSTTQGSSSNNPNDASLTAKEVLYPCGERALMDFSSSCDPALQAMYVKSHGSYQPGQQRTRGYDWKGIDPKTYRFGSTGLGQKTTPGSCREEGNSSVAECLAQGVDGNVTSSTVLAPSSVEMFKQFTSFPLGRSKPRGLVQSPSTCSENVPCGSFTPTKTVAQDTAKSCIHGNYSLEEQLPDADLGKATRMGWRNEVKEGEESNKLSSNASRVFGCPTVRTDIPPPAQRSVSDSQNYGDDTNAAMLLYPSRFSTMGVENDDFLQLRSSQEIRNIFANIGYTFDDDNFHHLMQTASAAETRETSNNNQSEEKTSTCSTSVHAFRVALNEKLDAQDELNTKM